MHWLDVLIGGSSATVVLTAIGTLFAKRIRGILTAIAREAMALGMANIQEDVAAVKLQLAAETGGNSNGLRQKLNTVAEDVAHLKGVLTPVLVLPQPNAPIIQQQPAAAIAPTTTEVTSHTTTTTTGG